MARPRGPLTLLPKAAIGLLHEISRHLLRRPVVGICAIARTPVSYTHLTLPTNREV